MGNVVTFPALPQARIVAVKHATPLPAARRRAAPLEAIRAKLARLRTQTAALNFEIKLRRLSRSFETRYSPNQPRAPAGSPEGGQWTSGGGGSGSVSDLSPVKSRSTRSPMSSVMPERCSSVKERELILL